MIKTNHFEISPETLNTIAQIDEFKGAWQALGTLAPERLLALRRVATIESIGSSTRIGGSKLEDSKIELLLSNLEIKSFNTRDEQEVAGYAKVIEGIFQSWENIQLTENYIKQLHSDLLIYSQKDERHRGEYKTSPNSIAAFDENGKKVGIILETARPFKTPRLMTELIDWHKQAHAEKRLHPLLIIGIFLVVFLEIHPFKDGNGRLSRLLTTLLLLQAGYVYVPYGSLENVIEQNKEGYYLALCQTQGTIRTNQPNWQPWLKFFQRALLQQMKNLAKKVEPKKVILSALPELSVQILNLTSEHGRITIGDLIKLTGTSRNALKRHLRQLIKKKHLVIHGHSRGAWYSLPNL